MIKTNIIKKDGLYILNFSGKVNFENKDSAKVMESKLQDMKKDDIDYW